jgi:putative membrane protein
MSGEGRVSDYLANERTFLAWIRTSIAVMSLGFVVAKFSLWLRLLGTRIQPQPPLRSTGTSLTLGVSMMAFGIVLAMAALMHYRAVNRAIARGDAGSDDRLVVGVSMLVAVLGVAMIGYMLSTR